MPNIPQLNVVQRYGKAIKAFPKKVDRTIVGSVFALTIFACLPSMIAFVSVSFARQRFAAWAQVLVVATLLALLLVWVWYSTGSRLRALFESEYKSTVRLAYFPLAVAVSLLSFSLFVYGAIAALMTDFALVKYTPTPDPTQWSVYTKFYAWHFLDLVPGLKIPESLNWAVPLKYEGWVPGAILLTYQLLVVGTVINIFREWNGARKKHGAATPAQ